LTQDNREVKLLQASLRSWKLALLIVLTGIVAGIFSVIFGLTAIPYLIALVLGIKLIKYPEVFLALFVFAGIFKAHPALTLPFNLDLTAIMGLLALSLTFLEISIAKKEIRFIFTKVDLFLVGFALLVTICLIHSRDRVYGMEKTAKLVFLGILASYYFPRIILNLSDTNKLVRNIFLTITISVGIAAVLTLSGFGTDSYRSFAGSPLGWGYSLGIAILATLTLVEITTNKIWRITLSIFIPILLTAMIMTRERGPLIALIVIASLILFWKGRFSVRSKIWFVISVSVVFSLLLIIMPREFWHRYELLFAQNKGSSIIDRVKAYGLAIQLFVDHPLIGSGTGSFHYFHGYFHYPHNIFLEIGAENGILGLVLFGGFLLYLVMSYRRISRNPNIGKINKKLCYGCFLIFLFQLIGLQFSGDITSRKLLFFAGLIILFGLRKTKNRNLTHIEMKSHI